MSGNEETVGIFAYTNDENIRLESFRVRFISGSQRQPRHFEQFFVRNGALSMAFVVLPPFVVVHLTTLVFQIMQQSAKDGEQR